MTAGMSRRVGGVWAGLFTPPPAPVGPTAKLTVTTSNLTITATSKSTAGSSPIASTAWDFDDSSSGTGTTVTHTYTGAGTYTVAVTVTDGNGLTSTASQTVTVTAPPPPPPGAPGDGGGNGATPSGAGITPWSALSGSTFSARVNAAGASTLVALPAGTYTFADFGISGSSGSMALQSFWFGANLTAKGLRGSGSKFTTVEMTPNTSTKASTVPAQGSFQSNNVDYLNITSSGATIDGVKIVGTAQGHLYNGIRFTACANPTLSNSTVTGIPGNAGSPPGETFGVNFQGCTGTVTVTNVTVDGQNVGAAAMGSNNSGATYNITNYLAINSVYSAGWASWEHSGTMNFRGFVVHNCARAFNAERLVGTVNFYDPIWDDPLSGHYDVNPTYEPGWAGGILNFWFTDTAAWQAFTAGRSKKTITAVSNSSSVSTGLVKSDVVRVYIGGVRQTQSSYVTWTGI